MPTWLLRNHETGVSSRSSRPEYRSLTIDVRRSHRRTASPPALNVLSDSIPCPSTACFRCVRNNDCRISRPVLGGTQCTFSRTSSRMTPASHRIHLVDSSHWQLASLESGRKPAGGTSSWAPDHPEPSEVKQWCTQRKCKGDRFIFNWICPLICASDCFITPATNMEKSFPRKYEGDVSGNIAQLPLPTFLQILIAQENGGAFTICVDKYLVNISSLTSATVQSSFH